MKGHSSPILQEKINITISLGGHRSSHSVTGYMHYNPAENNTSESVINRAMHRAIINNTGALTNELLLLKMRTKSTKLSNLFR